jgi:hypothetical protein
MSDEQRWCKKCKVVFAGQKCPASHANFMYSKTIPDAEAATPTGRHVPGPMAEPEPEPSDGTPLVEPEPAPSDGTPLVEPEPEPSDGTPAADGPRPCRNYQIDMSAATFGACKVERDFPYFSDMVDVSSLSGSIGLKELWEIVGTQLVTLASDGWDERYGQLQAYKNTHGNCRVPDGWPENKQLASWVARQRVEKTKFDNGDRKATITRERIKRLNDIGFTWDLKEQAWDKWYGQLQTYKNTHGNCNVPRDRSENKPLGSWASKQRQQKTKFDNGDHKAKIAPERISRLNAIGFVWDAGVGRALRPAAEVQGHAWQLQGVTGLA